MADPKDKDSWAKMAGDGLREIGLLYLVFGILDAQIEWKKDTAKPLDWGWFGLVLVVGVAFWSLGGFIERKRRE